MQKKNVFKKTKLYKPKNRENQRDPRRVVGLRGGSKEEKVGKRNGKKAFSRTSQTRVCVPV